MREPQTLALNSGIKHPALGSRIKGELESTQKAAFIFRFSNLSSILTRASRQHRGPNKIEFPWMERESLASVLSCTHRNINPFEFVLLENEDWLTIECGDNLV